MPSQLENNDRQKLVSACLTAREQSYSPYSKFRVGAALLTESGHIITGCNVENASYGLTICAERTALVKAVSEGHRKFRAIAVSTDVDASILPCGACRQFISEFGEMRVLSVSSDGNKVKEISVEEMLPHCFKPSDLIDVQVNGD